MRSVRFGVVLGVLATLAWLLWLSPQTMAARRKCPPFHLKTEDGQIINPLTGENADQPYSSRQTCGSCHEYDEITKGYHFQQGWNRISDDFSQDKPWVLSDGMMGKF
ncbi:MAG: hypothetical protein ACOC6L_02075 [Thermodesulfobacteriota bacterium]